MMRDATTHDQKRHRSSLSFVFLGLAALLVAGGVALFSAIPEPEAEPVSGESALAVRTFAVTRELIQPRTEVAGLLEARQRVELFAEEEGKVIEVGAEELDRVEADQLLMRLDPLRAELGVIRAEAALERAESALTLARASLERQGSLAGSAVASEAALDEAKNAESGARAALKEAQATLVEAEDRLAKKTLRAPFAGVLRSFPVKVGEYVRPGERVGELLEVDRLRITIGLTDREVVAASVGAPAQLSVEARRGRRFRGQVLRVGGATDPSSRKYPVQIEIPNPDGRLLPGMVARVELELGTPVELISVPREVVLEEFGVSFTYAVEGIASDAPVARRRRVEVRDIPFHPARLQVVSGLKVGDRIATSSLRQLRDGLAVAPLPESAGGHDRRAEEP